MSIAHQYGINSPFQCRLKGYDPKKDTPPAEKPKKQAVKELQQRVDSVKTKPAPAKKVKAAKKA